MDLSGPWLESKDPDDYACSRHRVCVVTWSSTANTPFYHHPCPPGFSSNRASRLAAPAAGRRSAELWAAPRAERQGAGPPDEAPHQGQGPVWVPGLRGPLLMWRRAWHCCVDSGPPAEWPEQNSGAEWAGPSGLVGTRCVCYMLTHILLYYRVQQNTSEV